MLLAIGLVVGVAIARLQPGPAEQAASASVVSLPPSATAMPALSWMGDYGTRHHNTPVQDPMGGWNDFLGTR